MKKNNVKTTIKFSVILFLTLFITNVFPHPFINYYYYDGKPYDLNWVSDKIFLVPNENVNDSQMESLFKDFPELQKQQNYKVEAELYFIL